MSTATHPTANVISDHFSDPMQKLTLKTSLRHQDSSLGTRVPGYPWYPYYSGRNSFTRTGSPIGRCTTCGVLPLRAGLGIPIAVLILPSLGPRQCNGGAYSPMRDTSRGRISGAFVPEAMQDFQNCLYQELLLSSVQKTMLSEIHFGLQIELCFASV
eukprot:3835777-Rhodomonas_salina.1